MNFFDKDRRISGKYKKIAYFLYLITAAALFFFWLFPEDQVRELVGRSVGSFNPKISIGIGAVGFSFPPGVKLRDVALSYKGGPVAEPDYIRVTPGLFSLFGKSPLFFFKSVVFGGIIHGDCRFMENRAAHADFQISGLKLENINFLSVISQHRITGLMDGALKVESNGSDVQTDSDIALSNVTVTFAKPVLGMPTIKFDTVKADLSATPRRIEIKTCTVKGQELDGEFSGHILVRQPYQKCILNLTGFFKPQAAFIKKAGRTMPIEFLMKNESGAKGFPVKVTGALQTPEIAFR